jgi:hypothetical protein
VTFEIKIGNPAGERRTVLVKLTRDEANASVGQPVVQQAYALRRLYQEELLPSVDWQHVRGGITRVYAQ